METKKQQEKRIREDYKYYRIQQLEELIEPLKRWESELKELKRR